MRKLVIALIACAGIAAVAPALAAPTAETRSPQALPNVDLVSPVGAKQVGQTKNKLAADTADGTDEGRARRKTKRKGMFFGLGAGAALIGGGIGAVGSSNGGSVSP